MGQIIVRQIPEEVHVALRARAKQENKSAEALVREILQENLVPMRKLGFGQRLTAVWQGADTEGLELEREPYEPVDLT